MLKSQEEHELAKRRRKCHCFLRRFPAPVQTLRQDVRFGAPQGAPGRLRQEGGILRFEGNTAS